MTGTTRKEGLLEGSKWKHVKHHIKHATVCMDVAKAKFAAILRKIVKTWNPIRKNVENFVQLWK